MKIAIAQMNTVPGDFDVTVERMLEFARQAQGQGAQLVLFPYVALTGDEPVPQADQEGFLLDAAKAVGALADQLEVDALVPVVATYGRDPMPEVMLVRDHQVTPLRLTAYVSGLMADDDADKDEPSSIPQLELGGCKLAVSFGDDDLDELRDYEYDANVIVHFNSFPFALNDTSSAMGCGLSNNRYVDDADQTGAWLVGVNGVGGYGDEAFIGSSFVLAPWGEVAAQAPTLEEALLVVDVDPAEEGPLAHPLEREVYDPGLTGWGALSLCVRDLVAKSDRTDVAVLLDGTLQSALVAALATDSVGPVRVHAVLVRPADARILAATRNTARALRIQDVREVDLGAAGDAGRREALAQVELASLARQTGALALGNRDKTSRALDDLAAGVGAACVEPLGDVYRTDVLWLAHMRNTMSPVIARELLSAYACPDIPGLDQVGSTPEARLEFVDSVIENHVDWGRSVTDVWSYAGGRTAALEVMRRVRDHELGRAMAGGCPIVLSRTALADDPSALVGPWRDRPRTEEELGEMSQLEGLAMGLGQDGEPTGAGDQGSSPEQARGIADFLRDYLGGAYGDPQAPQGQGDKGQGAPGGQGEGWNPFSEN